MYNRDTGSAKNKTNEGIWGMEGNLTKGPIMKTLVKLAVPIMASAFLGTLYNITDMAWIGLLGSKAVAGVGVGGMFTWLSQGLASMARRTGSGGTVYRARGPGKSPRICPGCSAAFSGNGNRVCGPLSHICQSDGGIF